MSSPPNTLSRCRCRAEAGYADLGRHHFQRRTQPNASSQRGTERVQDCHGYARRLCRRHCAGERRARRRTRWDLTFFVGRAFPTYDERLTPGRRPRRCQAWTSTWWDRRLSRRTAGRCSVARWRSSSAFSASRAGSMPPKWGSSSPARYNLRGTEPPFEGLTASVTLADGIRRRSHPAPVGQCENWTWARCSGCLWRPQLSQRHHRDRVRSASRRDTGYPFDRLRPEVDAPRRAGPIRAPMGVNGGRPAHRRPRGADRRGPGLLLPRV